MIRLGREFYSQRATEAAFLLLGKLLCVNRGGHILRERITETECYFGETDSACHASRGKKPRCSMLYEAGGRAYVYLCYGIHEMMNVVTGPEGFPEAVLIRGVSGAEGPGRLTKLLGVDRSMNGEDLISSGRLWIEDDGTRSEYKVFKRVGIDYAAKDDRERLWRFRALQ